MNSMPTATTMIGMLVILAGGLFLAGCHHNRWSETRWRELPAEERAEKITGRLSRHLDLNEAQRLEASNLARELIEESEAARTAGESLHTAMAAEMRKDHPDPARVEALIRERLSEFDALSAIAAEKLVRFHAILTPAQRSKMADEIERHAGGGRHAHRF